VCAYCEGSQTVTHDEAKCYDRTKIDEVSCPHRGKGLTGLNSVLCSSREKSEYSEDDIDEVDCPRCGAEG
jgi:hypothetical protein